MTREINWSGFRKCTVCKAETGYACRSVSGSVYLGRPDGESTVLSVPHPSRRLRVGQTPYRQSTADA